MSTGAGSTGPVPDAVRSVMGPWRRRPADSVLLVDFDGTLAPIVADPAAARPLPGAVPALEALAATMRTVGVVSGRPAAFLARVLDQAPGVSIYGLYGMERRVGDGPPRALPDAERWRPVVDRVAARAEGQAPPGIRVERKGLSVTLHWRGSVAAAPWAATFAARSAEDGLELQHGRMAIELRPPVAMDKGIVIAECALGAGAVAYLGDDVGDLPAFEVLAGMRSPVCRTASVAVVDAESPPEVAVAADVTVDGPPGVLALLRWLADPVGGAPL